MAKYQKANGDSTTASDPERELWYSAAPTCGYWTDDWSRLRARTTKSSDGGIPCCPHCGSVGMQGSYREWSQGAATYEKSGNLHYVEFLESNKEVCGRQQAGKPTWMQRYRAFLEKKNNA